MKYTNIYVEQYKCKKYKIVLKKVHVNIYIYIYVEMRIKTYDLHYFLDRFVI